MPAWMPMFALPNIQIRAPIEVDGFALVSHQDDRLQRLAKKHRRFGSYLRRFTNEFGLPVEPTIILCRNDAPEGYRRVDAIAAFRDAIAMSIIPGSWAKALRWENNSGIMYSDYFKVYPWIVSKNYDGLIGRTLDMMGWHEVTKLKGQSTPGLSLRAIEQSPIDYPLLGALLARWQRCFSADNPLSEDVQLFRSLNMANSAAQMPAGAEVTIYDIGRSVALWSSAFEILAPADGSAYRKVYSLLERINWNYTPCKEEKYEAYGYNKDKRLRALPIWIYGAINHARNDYLHGNVIAPSRLVVPPAKRPLNLYTAPLYRMALASFIDLKHERTKPRTADITPYMVYLQDQFEFGKYQRDIEVALSTVMLTMEEYRESRKRASRRS